LIDLLTACGSPEEKKAKFFNKGQAPQIFIERVYNPIMENGEKTTPNLPHHQKKGISVITNPL